MFGTIPEFNQSLEMFKTMWGQGAAGNVGQFPFTTDASKAAGGLGAAFPGMDIEELEKRIKDLKSVENWLNLNLNILKSTCLLYTSPSPRDGLLSRMPSSA